MRKKNIILFIIDSLNNTRIRQYGDVLMPAFTKLKKEYCYCDSMYSQAPYTEAALMSLYCGQDVLQNNGYLFRFRDADATFFELMKENGYTTFFNSYQPQCYPSSLRRGVDDIYYNVGFDIGAFWSYRLYHYSELLKKNELTEGDYSALTELLQDNFDEWLIFLDAIIKSDRSVEMIQGNAGDYDAEGVKEEVLSQQKLFQDSPKLYINDVLQQGRSHKLFNIKAYDQVTKIKDRTITEKNCRKVKALFKDIWWKNIRRNISSLPVLISIIFKSFLSFVVNPTHDNKKDFLKAAYYSLNHLLDFDLRSRARNDYDSFKNAPSARTHLDHFFKWADDYKSDKPFFACVHVDDVHNPEVFLTYDTEDESVFDNDISLAKNTIANLPKGSKGSVTHDLSLRYIDNVIKYLVDTVNQKEYGKDTSIIICADHGFSFGGDPIRKTYVTNLYLENYNIPFLIIDQDLRGISIDGLRESKDIPSLIRDMAEDSAKAIEQLPEYPVCTIEYCGGGCPDLSRRELKLAAFDNNYFVGTLCELNKNLTDTNLTEIYDLSTDPEQKKNLAGQSFDKGKVNELLLTVENRREEIKRSGKWKRK